jgi:hypothetical protein
VTIAGIAQIALFRLIRFTLQLRRRAQKLRGTSTMSARINHAKSFQMKQIVPQSTIGNRRIDLCADIRTLLTYTDCDDIENRLEGRKESSEEIAEESCPEGLQ